MPDNIIIDAERMKYPHTGLYHFCLHLGKTLLQQQPANAATPAFYVPPGAVNLFGTNTPYRLQHSLHKFWLPFANQYAIWHSTFQGTNYFPAGSKAKIVLTVHDLNFLHEGKSPAKEQKYLKAVQRKIDRADAVVAISQFTKKELETHIQLKQKEVHVIYNGCNINTEVVAEKPATVPHTPFIFTIGTIAAKKNFHVLPRMLVNNQLSLVIAGINQSPEYRQKILDEAAQYGVGDRVFLPGAVTESEKYWYLQNCAAFTLPSLAEGFGLPIIEAMHFGKPLLLSTYTSVPEIGGDLASYFHSYEAADMSALALHTIEAHAANAEQHAQQLFERSQLFQWKNAADQYWQLYQQLLNKK
ncbi:Glycosyltransferase involved in cell wall bisynthesis [Filimonas lacunae]|uniref:Glycosyltransferase involved in cell wall bisynthesis n=1 Tax=Filimonas lacunae TaxID=477680 RepID=A0A173MQR0_9BACT|nr:glycosyltransferase family 1 protein [Filimonas lacunae]BAV09827.1 glycosyltransferase [Filimonas lacunae]SIS79551.1 Glycosyltransferase involved in cell wall bisynthesis [Filimonas lacunae]